MFYSLVLHYFSEYFCVFIQEDMAQAWAFSGKILENKLFLKGLSGGVLALF